MMDDKKNYGFPYVHRIHQAPGVYVCPIHHKPLVLSSFGKSMDPFEQLIEKKPNPYMDTALADQYAVFCKELLENPLPYCASVLEEAVCIKTGIRTQNIDIQSKN